jgi:hypothetical protein
MNILRSVESFNTFELYRCNTILILLNRGERKGVTEEDQRVGLEHKLFRPAALFAFR